MGEAQKTFRLKGRSGLYVELVDADELSKRVEVSEAAVATEDSQLVGYLLTPKDYERIMDVYEDQELNRIADERRGQDRVTVAYDDL